MAWPWVTPIGIFQKVFDIFLIAERRQMDVRRGIPSFASISVTPRTLFKKNRGGVGSGPPPRRSRVKAPNFMQRLIFPDSRSQSAFWPFPKSITAICPVCPQAIFVREDDVLFWSSMNRKYLIKIQQQSFMASLRSKLDWEHSNEGVAALGHR